MDSLAARVASKLEEGDFKCTVHLSSSDDSIARKDERTLEALKQKHPSPHPESQIPSPEPIHSLTILEEDLAQAIRFFPCGSVSKPDGLLPQHLKDMTGTSAEVSG